MVKKLKKQFETPNEGWNEERINREDEITEEFGLQNKTEVYKAQSQLRDLRCQARNLATSENGEQRRNFLNRVKRLGLIREDGGLEDVLSLNVEDILNRRLQSSVSRRGHAETSNEARQLVVHGHVSIDGQRINVPGYLLTQEEEKKVNVEEFEEEEEKPEEVEEEREPEETSEEQNEEEEE